MATSVGGAEDVIIQQDNAKRHVTNDYLNLAIDLVKDDMGIKMINQPPNSPELNVLEFGFFCAIHFLQQQQYMSGIADFLLPPKEHIKTFRLKI